MTDVVDIPTLLRIIQSIPSPQAEPFKQWLASLGTERLEDLDNPELLLKRMKAMYTAKGYPPDWIELCMQAIIVRNQLTSEWQVRGARSDLDYAVLTNEIAKSTFGVGVQKHKELKGLKRKI